MARGILAAFECYSRSGDIDNAKCDDYIYVETPLGPSGTYYGILSLPKTKRGLNESVYVRDPLVAELLRRQAHVISEGRKHSKNKMLTFAMPTIRKRMKIILAMFGVVLANTALHGL